ncbi:alpha-L-fucosidase [Paenibacillus pectinilyticus]|uniref:Alpha-L-fucosidase n=1 Tax=Paenibacillus pectinilyticus TaxID=512399 RepID=A0A1C1A4T2_9BACL|nr:glycoside hydrolase family 95 protein [Paenibacillus pectinilyticus]OCT15500.1 alpha-L-fucosidase [Paenibacillus pectinilyticus]
MKLSYERPANAWTEALPLGNSRLGAMFFGGVEQEQLQLNEESLWSGAPRDWHNPQAIQILPEVREQLEAGNYAEADLLARKMMGPYTQSYLPMGHLFLAMEHGSIHRDYNRCLDLQDGVAKVTYRIGKVIYTREMFVSHPDQVIVVRLSASEPGMLNLRASLQSDLRFDTTASESQLVLQGYAPEQVDPSYYETSQPIVYGDPATTKAMRFEVRLAAQQEGGSCKADANGLHIYGATSVTLFVSAATSFNGHDRVPGHDGKDPSVYTKQTLNKALQLSWADLRERHVEDYKSLFDRVSLDLGASLTAESLPSELLSTDQRIVAYGATDVGLVQLLFQYGRYLMITSSRPGSLPANLQGIWNKETRPPWSSNWTLNINAQMNYWPVETCNLAECHEPLLDFIGHLAANGQETARIHYGADGWVAHHNTDIWCQTSPVGDYGHGDPVWAFWPMGGVWLAQHLWEHYAFGGDLAFLRDKAYPTMKGAALFCLDWLIEDEDGKLITSPSTSPEHKYVVDGVTYGVSKASTMDMALMWDLFTNCIEAAALLEDDTDWRDRLVEARSRLLPMQIGQYGQLQEWSQDFEDEDVHHRHVSHLFGVYPGRQITAADEPRFFEAARQSLERRGDGGTGWSLGWKISLWARFGDGNRALGLIANLLTLVDSDKENYHIGGVYANLFDAHPPFQIDGNFAVTAGIAEMLMQSYQGYIQFLPALPDAWGTGSVKGLRARGGFEISLSWKDHRVTDATVLSKLGGLCRVRAGASAHWRVVAGEQGEIPFVLEDGLVQFQTERDGAYRLLLVE